MHRKWQLYQSVTWSKGAGGKASKIRPARIGEIGVRHNARIDPIAKLEQRCEGSGTETVAPGLIDRGPPAKGVLNPRGQPHELLALERRRQISRKGVVRVDYLLVRRAYPRMQMGADLASSIISNRAQNGYGFRRVCHRIVHHVNRHDAVAIHDLLRQRLNKNIRRAAGTGIERRVPVELLFRIDDDDQCGWPLGRQIERAPGRIGL